MTAEVPMQRSTEEAESLKKLSAFLSHLASKKPLTSDVTLQVARWASEIDEGNEKARLLEARCLMAYGNWKEALGVLNGSGLPVDDPEVLINASICLDQMGDILGAVTHARGVLLSNWRGRPAILARLQLFGLYHQMGWYDEMRTVIEEGLAEDPENQELIFARAEIRLLTGDEEGGLKDNESRPTRLSLLRHMDEYTEWTGQDLRGKTILVMREQGFGDEIQAARHLPLLAQLGGKVLLFTYADLSLLLARVKGVHSVITSEEDIPDFDYWVASGSLALRLQKYSGLIGNEPYIEAWARASQDLVNALAVPPGKLKVGIRWRGNSKQPRERHRGFPQYLVQALVCEMPDAAFYSLEYEAGDQTGLPKVLESCRDVADLADAMMMMDVIITTDTMVAHLAGAIGRKVILLLGNASDCRWGLPLPFSTLPEFAHSLYPKTRIIRKVGSRSWEKAYDELKEVVRLEQPGRSLIPAPVSHPAVSTGPTKYGRMSWYRGDKYIGRSLELYGEYSPGEAALLTHLLDPGDAVVEAGANIGALTVPIALKVGCHGLVIAFEPQPKFFRLLKENCKHLPQVTASDSALGSIDGETILLPDVSEHKTYATSLGTGLPSVERESTTLDLFIDMLSIRSLRLIKIDVDGMEMDILKGAQRTIETLRPILYVENDKPEKYPDLIPWIDGLGYRIYQHDSRLFSRENWGKCSINVFGNMMSRMLLCIPTGEKTLRYDTLKQFGIDRVKVTVGNPGF